MCVKLASILHSHSQHLINNFDSFVLFFIPRFYRLVFQIAVKKKREKNKKVCQYNERLLHLHSQQHRINTFHSFVLFHLLSTVKKKKKPRGRVNEDATVPRREAIFFQCNF